MYKNIIVNIIKKRLRKSFLTETSFSKEKFYSKFGIYQRKNEKIWNMRLYISNKNVYLGLKTDEENVQN